MYTPIVDETVATHPVAPRRRWYHTFALGVLGGAATAACVLCAICFMNDSFPWMPEPFDATLCVQNDANRMRGQPEDIGTRELGMWLSPACQHALSCGASPSLILDRPCTQEDKLAGARGAVRHIAPTVVSHHFRTVYVANPTSVDYLVRAVMHRHLMAEDGNSTEISTHMRLAYFFFSFVEHTQDRFFNAAEQQLQVFNASDSCAVMRDRMTSLTDLRAWSNTPRVSSQAFLLSAEAGSSNKMINYHWLGDATLVSHGIIDVLLRIQLHAELCLPVIDFKWLNFEVVHNNLAHSSAVRALQACGDAGLKKRVMDVYTQDSQCFGL